MSVNTFLPPSPVVPPFLIITAITNSNPCQVTVSTSNTYVANQLVRFFVPSDYGMSQINGVTGQIISVDVTNLIFLVNINTMQFDVFSLPSPGPFVPQPATLSPAGSRNLYNINQVPFHSLNGMVGN